MARIVAAVGLTAECRLRVNFPPAAHVRGTAGLTPVADYLVRRNERASRAKNRLNTCRAYVGDGPFQAAKASVAVSEALGAEQSEPNGSMFTRNAL